VRHLKTSIVGNGNVNKDFILLYFFCFHHPSIFFLLKLEPHSFNYYFFYFDFFKIDVFFSVSSFNIKLIEN
jgi:hypothetical protein